MMHYPTITAVTAAIFGLIYLSLTMRVGLFRSQVGIPLGDGDNASLRRRVRAHGNFAEYVPMVLILLGLIEGTGAPDYIVVGIATVFLIARLMHAVGLSVSDGSSVGRVVGAMGTISVLFGTSIWLGYLVINQIVA